MALPGDGCCTVAALERAADGDCVSYAVNLEGRGFAGPSVDVESREAYVGLVRRSEERQVDEIHLAAVDVGGVARILGVAGDGGLETLAPPVVTEGGVWIGFDLGIRRFGVEGAESALIADSPRPGKFAANRAGCVAWWASQREGLGIAWPDESQEARFWPIPLAASDAGDGEPLGPAFTASGEVVVGVVEGKLWAWDSQDGDELGDLSLGSEDEEVVDLCLLAEDVYLLGAQGRLWAVAIEDNGPRLRWQLTLEAGALDQCYADRAGRLLVPSPDGVLSVVEQLDGSPQVSELSLPWTEAVGPGFWLADGVAVFQGSDKALHMFRLPQDGGSVVVEGWRQTFANGFIGSLSADTDGFLYTIDGAGTLARLQSGALGDSSAVWPGVAGGSARRGIPGLPAGL